MNDSDRNPSDEAEAEAATEVPIAPPASEDVLAEWDAAYEKAWRDRDLRAHSNDIFSLERESGMIFGHSLQTTNNRALFSSITGRGSSTAN